MRFLMTTGENSRQPDESLFADMGAFIEEMTASGHLIATGGLDPAGVRMTSHGDEIVVTDGPFAEAREVVTGFAIIEAATEEEAMELARRFRRIVGDGSSMIQKIFTA